MSVMPKHEPYEGPAGGWGSVRSLADMLTKEQAPISSSKVLYTQNKPDGFMCVSCAWAKPADPHVFEFCENGAKATTWEITSKRVTPAFFAARTVTEIDRTFDDHQLEAAGRLTHPMRWDAATDKYVPVSWEEAFAEIGRELKALDPKSVVFYSSGRASLETAYMYGLLARAYGNNNLPDSSNMCHESTSVALPESIGVPVGTVTLDDFDKTDCIFFFGQNVGTSSPRMLHQLQHAAKRGVPIVTFNPLRERGLERFANPQSPTEMLSGSSTRISSQYHQVKTGGDTAAMIGIAKALFALEKQGKTNGGGAVIDHEFIAEHTHGFDEYKKSVEDTSWDHIERRSGLTRGALEAAAVVYAHARRVIFIYGMGLTQHKKGVQTVQTMCNLAFLRGNIGRPGAGICPVRGHSNVQGQRTVGITEKPEKIPKDKLKMLFDLDVPEDKGMNTVEACEGILDGRVRAMFQLGGNLVRAVPDHSRIHPAWKRLRLTVTILTKLNRSALIHGEVSYILPCLGRSEIDVQATGPQVVTMEDSTGCMHASTPQVTPASEHLKSEPAIIAGIAKAALPPNKVPWDIFVDDYGEVREAIAQTYPDIFHDFNQRMFTPGGFHRPLGARHRKWDTKTGKANFIVPDSLAEDIDEPGRRDVVQLITLRSNGQFNTTVYSYDDRFRGIYGSRMVLMMHRNDIDRFGLKEGDVVGLETAVDDGVARKIDGFRVIAYDIPEGCIGGYYPECNPLIPLWHHAEGSKVPAAKSIPVKILARAPPPAIASE